MKLSIAYITGRAEPHVGWMLESLEPQIRAGDQIELLVIDLHERAALDLVEPELVQRLHAVDIKISAPKPNIWQGPHRVTSCDWWAKSSAINTAIVLATHDYLAAVDDRCRLGPLWLDEVRKGERARASVLCGSYDRHEDGRTVPDGRRASSPRGTIGCGGGWLYGCTWALPLAWALAVNGFEEGTDGMGGEDYIFGLNLQHAGYRLDFVPALFVELERSARHSDRGPDGRVLPFQGPTPRRTDKGISPRDKSHAALDRFGKRNRTEFTPHLTELRALRARGYPWPRPDPQADHRDWYDGQPIRDMR